MEGDLQSWRAAIISWRPYCQDPPKCIVGGGGGGVRPIGIIDRIWQAYRFVIGCRCDMGECVLSPKWVGMIAVIRTSNAIQRSTGTIARIRGLRAGRWVGGRGSIAGIGGLG